MASTALIAQGLLLGSDHGYISVLCSVVPKHLHVYLISVILFAKNYIQPARLEHLKCLTFGIEMLAHEADLATRMYFGGDIPIPETPVGVLIFCW